MAETWKEFYDNNGFTSPNWDRLNEGGATQPANAAGLAGQYTVPNVNGSVESKWVDYSQFYDGVYAGYDLTPRESTPINHWYGAVNPTQDMSGIAVVRNRDTLTGSYSEPLNFGTGGGNDPVMLGQAMPRNRPDRPVTVTNPRGASSATAPGSAPENIYAYANGGVAPAATGDYWTDFANGFKSTFEPARVKTNVQINELVGTGIGAAAGQVIAGPVGGVAGGVLQSLLGNLVSKIFQGRVTAPPAQVGSFFGGNNMTIQQASAHYEAAQAEQYMPANVPAKQTSIVQSFIDRGLSPASAYDTANAEAKRIARENSGRETSSGGYASYGSISDRIESEGGLWAAHN